MGIEGYLVFGLFFVLCISKMQRSDTILYYSDNINKRRLVSSLAVLLFLLGALRSYSTGIDTYNYAMKFKYGYSSLGFAEAFQVIKEAGLDGEKGYEVLASLFGSIIPSIQLWLAFLWGTFVIACAKLIFRYSDCPPFSFLYLVASLIATFMWQGLRQSVAATVCLVSYKYLVDKKYLKYLICMLVAFLFHRSSLIFLLAIPALIMPVGIWSFVIIIVSFVMSSLTPSRVVNYILEVSNLLQMDSLAEKVGLYVSGIGTRTGTLSYFFVLLAIYAVCYFVKDELLLRDRTNQLLLNLSMFGVCLQAMSVIIPEFFRVSYYFSIFNMILVPNACTVYSERSPGLKMRAILIFFLILMFFWVGGLDYWFCWQQSAW